jgi:hypothetical protein
MTWFHRTAAITFAALCFGGLFAAAAPATQTFSTSVFLNTKFPAFHGRVHSQSEFCVQDRKVKLLRSRNGGAFKVIGATKTDNKGHWKIKTTPLGGSTYFAKAPAYGSAALGTQCLPSKSKSATVD